MKLLEEIKSHSSKWMKTKDQQLKEFYRQKGYGTFSVNPKGVERVKSYIQNQHIHHAKKTFQDEYRGILNKYNIKYDEKYVWD